MTTKSRPRSRWHYLLGLMTIVYIVMVPVNLLMGDIPAAVTSAVLAPVAWWISTTV